ncbi:MAG TPA: hypothetical protein VKX17_10415 [Planctomycetota bacterium]|nr:hypothetical protein [Planctomycetota bacterium]
MKKDKNKYPRGWDAARVKKVLDHYENQTEDEAVQEYEAAWNDQSVTFMPIPHALVPKVRKLIAAKSAT